ncbi:MAG: geranylgeranyl pyrophosphate synthase/predicted secreted hydrolase [Chitinophagales bacterium]|jgi:geranylgeranyl pyrophosphate synthase/predicted secreted hydrolase
MNKLHNNFTRPKDWPQGETIDLDIHDLPHASSTTEWWYINAHIESAEGRKYSIFASFFRRLLKFNEETKELDYAHSITWALIDVEKEKYYNNSLIDQRTPKIGLEKLRKGEIVKDVRIRKAAIEMLEKGNVPYPDRLLENQAVVATDKLDLQYDRNSYRKLDDGRYELILEDVEHKVACTMILEPQKPVTRHGDNGVVFGVSAEDMFYYFIPRNKANGHIEIEGEKIPFENSSAWYDHEFGRHRDEKENDPAASKDVAWNWISSQLTNGYEFTAYDLIDNETNKGVGSYLILIDPDGKRTQVEEFSLRPKGADWTSTRTFNDYPLEWVLEAPSIGLYVEAKACFANQEYATVISKPAFWEGRVEVKGKLGNEEIDGPGFVERSGFISSSNLEEFFKVVSRETIKSVKKILPKNPEGEKLAELVSRKDQVHFTHGIDNVEFSKALVEPIRDIIDRGGKSWRSYAALACCDIVGGNSQQAKDWLALPEMMHVGSLIVDDVEDQSDVRRGGPSCHKLYNEAVAINAGSACYFLGQIVIYRAEELEDSKKLRIYNLYFEALRAAHAGQALDIHGLDYMMDEVVEDGAGRVLEERILAIHRLKSAAPASMLAQVGVLLGSGSEVQIKALGDYYEALGISFQIIDDTLNLRGFKDGLKTKGEDITAGKITYPVAKAMTRLEKNDRARLWEIVKAKTDDLVLIKEAVDLLDKVDALDDCVKEAKDILNDAWKLLDPIVRDSMVKLNLRAFSWYVLDRHY